MFPAARSPCSTDRCLVWWFRIKGNTRHPASHSGTAPHTLIQFFYMHPTLSLSKQRTNLLISSSGEYNAACTCGSVHTYGCVLSQRVPVEAFSCQSRQTSTLLHPAGSHTLPPTYCLHCTFARILPVLSEAFFFIPLKFSSAPQDLLKRLKLFLHSVSV